MKPVVLTFVSRYLPGYKSGGPVRTIANMVEHLNEDLDFRIVTLDRDTRDSPPYDGISVNAWNAVGKAQVYYLQEDAMQAHRVARLLRETRHDVLYLNSFFDPRFTALPLLAKRLGIAAKSPVVLAPRGEFSDGALSLKSWKKRPYIALTRSLGFFRDLIWQVSSPFEALDVRRVMGAYARKVEIAPNLSARPLDGKLLLSKRREAGAALRVVFLSRITPKKNLDFALRVLEKVRAPVDFSIVGPVADKKHWRVCEGLMSRLPANITIATRGSVEPPEVPELMAEHDLFFLPTRGENYGHVIAEALSVGTPVLIADTTPWRGLRELGVGWDISLGAESQFVNAIEEAAAKGADEYASWRRRVVQYATERLADPSAVEANRRLFLEACGRAG